jgi:hypothetical protein
MTPHADRLPCRPRLARVAGLLLSAAIAAPALAQPQDTPSPLRLSGYGTAGLVWSSVDAPWSFRRDVLQPGTGRGVQTRVDSRLGLQANLALPHDLEAVVQGVLKPQAADADWTQHVEWAFLAWRPLPDVTVRAGRVSNDTFLASEYRNVGFAYPWVRPNMEFYGWTPLPSLDGADAVKEWRLGSARWRVKVMAGQSNLAVPTVPGQTLDFHARNAFGIAVSREAGGLLLKFSHVRMDLHFSGSTDLAPVVNTLRAIENDPLAPPTMQAEARALRESMPVGEFPGRFTTLSVQYTGGPWLAQAELSHSDSNAAGPNDWHAYGAVAWRFAPFTVFGMAGRAKPDGDAARTPTTWPAPLARVGGVAALTANLARVDQRSVSAGLRWDFHPQAAAKFQVDHFKVHPTGSGLWADADFSPRSANVLSVVIDTVF